MWSKKLKRFLVLLLLLLPWSCVPFASFSYADVVLTETEAQELMNEIQESRKDLTELKSQLNEAETQLSDVKKDCEEQKKSYEKQLEEEKQRSTEAKVYALGASATTILISIALIIALL